MNSKERVLKALGFEKPDHVPLYDYYWPEFVDNWRAAKLHTRCGMGACQGRICGAAAQFLFGWDNDSVRPPAFPVRVGSLMSADPTDPTAATPTQPRV